MNWNNYLSKTKKSNPRPLLVEAFRYVKNHNTALDLGCGAMNDTLEIFNNNFKTIDAVDSNLLITDIANDITAAGFDLKFYPVQFLNFIFTPNSYDLISAQYSLPFIDPDNFFELWSKIESSLRQSGVFTGQFFGPEDTWVTRSDMTFLTKNQVKSLFPANVWKLHKCTEFNGAGETVNGNSKNWHIFHVIAEKRIINH